MTASIENGNRSDNLDKLLIGGFESDRGACKIVDGNPCSVCRELDEVDELAKALLRRRTAVKRRFNETHDPITSLLPVEIVSLIFAIVVDLTRDPFESWTFGFENRPVHHRFAKADCSVPLVLSAVCKSWREVAFATPRLWTKVDIFVYSEDKVPVLCELTRQWLDRSRQFPLILSLYHDYWRVNADPPSGNEDSDTEDESDEKEEFKKMVGLLLPLFDVVRASAPRWQALRLAMHWEFYPLLFGDVRCLPNLKSLRIICTDCEWGRIVPLETPSLGELIMGGEPFPLYNMPIQWDNVTSITWNTSSVDEILELLRLAEKLQTGIFPDAISNRMEHDLEPVIHHSLKKLEVHIRIGRGIVREEGFANDFFDCLKVPSLECFTLTASPDDVDPDVAFLVNFLSSCRETLKTFALSAPPDYFINADQLVEVLQSIPSTRSLLLHVSWEGVKKDSENLWITDAFFGHFNPTRDQHTLLPNLCNLEITSDCSFDWLTVQAMIEVLYERSRAEIAQSLLVSDSSLDNRVNIRINLTSTTEKDFIPLYRLVPLVDGRWSDKMSIQILDQSSGKDFVVVSAFHHLGSFAQMNASNEEITSVGTYNFGRLF
ncbi:hypothetical protein CVT26_007352 [Gymnopilus dilepis]|uniref:Uncharacterized protein n=1 Tax=Gymnopilus dilepis TaxID=231916 RepID=A0A409VPA0_9AGAR|nr:hypothetical protein CVT26_007352 [Gymnopilus dilepis]